jgi:hypothetical protein
MEGDLLALGSAARSRRSEELVPRTATADKVVASVCPYCAVGCGQKVYVKDEQVVQIEGGPDSPISRGRLCPKGAASRQLVNAPTLRRELPRRLTVLGVLAEVAAARRMERRLGTLAQPYHEKRAGTLSALAKAFSVAGGALALARGRRREGALAAGALVLAGSIFERAFCTISNDARPETSNTCSVNGRRSSIAALPIAKRPEVHGWPAADPPRGLGLGVFACRPLASSNPKKWC